jgi:hypothetical protein
MTAIAAAAAAAEAEEEEEAAAPSLPAAPGVPAREALRGGKFRGLRDGKMGGGARRRKLA